MVQTVALKDLCEIDITDGTHKTPTYTDEGYIFLSSKNVTNGKIDWEDVMYIPQELHEELYHRLAPQKDDILLAKNGTTGVAAIVDRDEVFDIYVSLALIRPDKRKIIPRYLLHAINSEQSKEFFNSHLKGIGVPNLHLTHIRETPIKVPTVAQQEYIVCVLDKTDTLIFLRKQQLAKLDELVKARFVEMFGDPLDGTAKYPIHQVGEVAEAVDPQPSHRTPPIEEGGVPYVSIKDCDYKTGIIDFEGARKVSKTVLEEHLNRYTLQDGDFIIGKIGTIGKPVFVPARNDYTLSANIVLVQPNSELVSPYFLKYSFESDFVERQFAEAKNSTSQAAFGIQKVRAIEVMNPELDVQRDFERFVKQTEKSKSAIQQSLDKLETLKGALMQKYFG